MDSNKIDRKGVEIYDILGIDIPEYRVWISRKWQPGMSWENYGEWEIDHIKEIKYFDLHDVEQLRKAFHYTNTRPRWKAENHAGSGRKRI